MKYIIGILIGAIGTLLLTGSVIHSNPEAPVHPHEPPVKRPLYDDPPLRLEKVGYAECRFTEGVFHIYKVMKHDKHVAMAIVDPTKKLPNLYVWLSTFPNAKAFKAAFMKTLASLCTPV